YLGAAAREAETVSSTGMTATGEWYWNFGPVGIVFGMLLTGLLFGLLWQMAGAFPITEPLRMLLYVIVTVESMVDQPEAVTIIVAGVANVLIFGTVLIFMHSHGKGQNRRFFDPLVLPVPRSAAPRPDGLPA